MVSAIARRPARLHYGWVVAAVTFAVLLVGAGVRAAPGVLIVPLEAEFHWSRATISFAVGVNLLLFGLVGPFAAALMDRFGVRRTMAAALVATAAGVALTPLMRASWQLTLLWGVVVGASCGIVGSYLSAYIATRWFRARQGLVVGMLTAANALGQLIFLPTMAGLVSVAGWRVMSLALAASVVVVAPVVALLMRERPQDLGIGPYGAPPGPLPAPRALGNPLAAAFRVLGLGVRQRDFWLIGGTYFVCGATTNGLIGTHLIPACVDHGLSEVTGAGLLAITAVFSFFGGTLSGWLSDRWDNRTLLAGYFLVRGVALIYLPFAFGMSYWGLSLFSVFYGLDWIATVPPIVRLLSRVVGSERTGVIVAWVTVIHQIGASLAAYLGGVLRISFGTYIEAFLFAGIACLVAAGMALMIGGDRREPEGAPAAAAAG